MVPLIRNSMKRCLPFDALPKNSGSLPGTIIMPGSCVLRAFLWAGMRSCCIRLLLYDKHGIWTNEVGREYDKPPLVLIFERYILACHHNYQRGSIKTSELVFAMDEFSGLFILGSRTVFR
ncbi:hypothetical protein AVEN_191872-1 [Araneus ventricosus]|uniref:Uncharacterized protein n=1 Tax=Araneus ventricosus TaxID=182803 RepID=A0A4Y2W702_ARAVE|nr:hypothetical protein AVEN_191872-1 [Araneus ventricosus]